MTPLSPLQQMASQYLAQHMRSGTVRANDASRQAAVEEVLGRALAPGELELITQTANALLEAVGQATKADRDARNTGGSVLGMQAPSTKGATFTRMASMTGAADLSLQQRDAALYTMNDNLRRVLDNIETNRPALLEAKEAASPGDGYRAVGDVSSAVREALAVDVQGLNGMQKHTHMARMADVLARVADAFPEQLPTVFKGYLQGPKQGGSAEIESFTAQIEPKILAALVTH